VNYRELRLLIRKLIKETSLLPGMETPSDLNPAFKRDDWNMSNMKPDQHVAFTIDDGLDDETYDEFLDLFGNKIEYSGDWIVASPKTADYIKKFIEREGGRFNLAPEEIVDWIIGNPDNNIIVEVGEENEEFMKSGENSNGTNADNGGALTNASTNGTADNPDGIEVNGGAPLANPDGTEATNDGKLANPGGIEVNDNPENVATDKKDTNIKIMAKDIEAKGIDEKTAAAIALYLANQYGTENPHKIVSDNFDLIRKLFGVEADKN